MTWSLCFALHSDEALLQKDSSMHTKRCDRNTISMCGARSRKSTMSFRTFAALFSLHDE